MAWRGLVAALLIVPLVGCGTRVTSEEINSAERAAGGGARFFGSHPLPAISVLETREMILYFVFKVLLESAPAGSERQGVSPMEVVLLGLGGCTAVDVMMRVTTTFEVER